MKAVGRESEREGSGEVWWAGERRGGRREAGWVRVWGRRVRAGERGSSGEVWWARQGGEAVDVVAGGRGRGRVGWRGGWRGGEAVGEAVGGSGIGEAPWARRWASRWACVDVRGGMGEAVGSWRA